MTAADRALSRLDAVARFRWVILSCWVVVTAALATTWHDGGDWGFFRVGAGALIGQAPPGVSGGIHLYASMPKTQIGPPALVAALPFRLLPEPWDVGVARVVMALAVLLVLWLVDRLLHATGVPEPQRARSILLGGLILVLAWVGLAVDFAHLDDVLVLVLGTLAFLLVAKERPMWAAVVIGVAMATKPWAVALLPVFLRSGWRASVRPVLVAGGVALAWWVPFLADPGTLTNLWDFRLVVRSGSGLTVLGVEPGSEMPGWVRPTQLLGGAALAAVTAARGRWSGVMLVGLACRVALDPNPIFYYGVGPLLGALIWDGSQGRRGIPWATGCVLAAFSITPFFGPPLVSAGWRVAVCAGMVAVVLVGRAGRGGRDAHGRELSVTVTAIADEVASAAELVRGKAAGRPVAVVRGLGRYVTDDDGPGARSLVRPSGDDLFREGSAEAYARGLADGAPDGQSRGGGT